MYETMTPPCGRSVVQVLVVRVDIGVVTYETMTPPCGRSVIQVLVIRVDIGMVTYDTSVCALIVVNAVLAEQNVLKALMFLHLFLI